ncbi:hypothetical protein P152DRAFT_398583 [Eremomyces bilateralis CBS 781.70]|uniref:Uncharacterized protein n=1 Tax=Eremomyces bilateralis CBS 781.70 TaxID=1392243 RepID=A0A6G1G192_9PEZI|nr:uncharacterized protein P152DRAFT_398583 [Eremomyces bilateralis CBS 781.70]KAF1811752.1 hypothetical protein P152DRAFT_398583 [Eremomyces bilateralis CBS 781.70]
MYSALRRQVDRTPDNWVDPLPSAPSSPLEDPFHTPIETQIVLQQYESLTLDDLYQCRPPRFPDRERYALNMGLCKLFHDDWIEVDERYLAYHSVRAKILEEMGSEAIHRVSGAEEAEKELFDEVVKHLIQKHGRFFEIIQSSPHISEKDGRQYASFSPRRIRNRLTGEEYRISQPTIPSPMEIVARLCQEDFSLLVKEQDGSHRLSVSLLATLFPAAWRLRERIGWHVTDLHGTVPMWPEKLSAPVEHYFSRLSSDSNMARFAFFPVVIPAGSTPAPHTFLFAQTPEDLVPKTPPARPEEVIFRFERQIFRRLPKTSAIVFTVKTSMAPLTSLNLEDCRRLAVTVRSWPAEVAEYRGVLIWGDMVLDWCDAQQKEYME